MDTPKLNFAHICDFAFNGEGGKLGIIGIFKNISIQNPEQPHPQMFVVTNVSVKSGGDYTQKIRLVKENNEDNDIIPPLVFSFSVKQKEEEIVEFGFIGQLNNVPFKESGKYFFKVYIGEKLLEKIPISVSIGGIPPLK